MLTLAAADTLAGVAQTAAVVTCSVFGMELVGTTETYKALDQRQLAAAAATIYTAPASTTVFVKTIDVVNTDTLNTQTFQLFRGGTAAANAITPVFTLPAGGCAIYEDGQGWKLHNSLGQVLGLGATGATGAVGAQAASIFLPGSDGDDGPPMLGLPSGAMGRAALGPDAKNWAYLGTIAGTGATVGPLIWTGQFQQIYFEYIIGGYSGAAIARILCGAASISTTALTNGNKLIEDITVNATSVSVPGCPLGGTAIVGGRSGWGSIKGASGAFKQITIQGMSNTPAVATAPLNFEASSFFSDLGTNLLIQRLQLTVYDAVTGAVVSANTLTATTQLWAWGRFND